MANASISNPIVHAALEALANGDRNAWLNLFSDDAILTDDGHNRGYIEWSDAELFGKGKGRVTSVNRVEADGLTLHTHFHSEEWGDFTTFWKFAVEDGKITRLEVGAE